MMEYAVVSYLPALHKGYLDFFKKYPGTLYVLGSDFVLKTPRMERDIRALAAEEVKSALHGLHLYQKIVVLDKDTLGELLRDPAPIVMPDDEINRVFAEAELKGKAVTFVSTFLRWDRQISTKEFEVPPDRVISENAFDKEVMAAALEESKKSPDWWRQIGAILIRDGKPVLTAHNTPLPSEYSLNAFGDPRSNFDANEGQYKDLSKFIHAEANIIAQAAKQGIKTDGASLYVTTFPCPACARSVAMAGVKELYYSKGYSMLDAEDILRAFGIKIIMVQ
jgi:dCMP deaminase